MSLLAIDHATKRYRRGRLERVAVRDVSLDLEPGELVGVYGPRRSGRSPLLRLAAGIESPDEGRVRFDGLDLAHARNRVLGRRIGFCQMEFAGSRRGLVVEHVGAGLLAQRVSPRQARRHGEELLYRVGAERCAKLECDELDSGEVARVAIASALVTAPALLVIDEPTSGVDPLERDPLLALLRSIANEGTSVLMSAADSQGLAGVDRALAMDNGELRGEARVSCAHVVPLRRTESGTRRL